MVTHATLSRRLALPALAIAAFWLVSLGCSDDSEGDPTDSQIAVFDGASDAGTTLDSAALDTPGVDLVASPDVVASPDSGACEGWFGRPNETTGMSEERCQPRCTCGDDTFAPTPADEALLTDLTARTLLDPPEPLTEDPYAHPDDFQRRPEAVCAFVQVDESAKTYRITTFDSAEAAEAAGASGSVAGTLVVTHTGACGLCSSLADLAVYMRYGDLTTPVRQCTLDGIGGDDEDTLSCLADLGFTRPCASIWFYNAKHTQDRCLATCLSLLSAPYQSEDGVPNDCIQCDEDESGPVFKAVAGRTRRNSGIATALCRPCATVSHVQHIYP